MDKNSRDPVHCWLVLVKAFQAASKYLYAGLAETGIDDTKFRILRALPKKGPFPGNTIGPKGFLPPRSLRVGVGPPVARGLVNPAGRPQSRGGRVLCPPPK